MRGAGLIATVVMTGGLWLFARGHGPTAPAGVPVYCADVTRVTVVATDARQMGGSGGAAQASSLASIAGRLRVDAAAVSQAGQAATSSALQGFAADVDQWRTAIISNDAVAETIALDRVLSVETTVPGC
jgi:hypothetical protein